jgi:hypothetical protein
MKAHLFALISAIPSTLGCLHYVGQIYLAPNGPELKVAWIIDDGVLVCEAGWGSSQSMAGYKVNCISGYSLEVGADGAAAWYGTPHGNFRWRQGYDRSDNFIVWDNWQFC